jgi:hypothetical protein
VETNDFVEQLTESQIKSRLMGKEIDAALGDPRWAAQDVVRQ